MPISLVLFDIEYWLIAHFEGTVVPATTGPLGERPPALAGHFCDVPTTLPC